MRNQIKTYLVRPHVRAYPDCPPQFIWDLDGFVAVDGDSRGEAVANFMYSEPPGSVVRWAAQPAARFEVFSGAGPFHPSGVPIQLYIMAATFKNNAVCDGCGSPFVDEVPPVDILCPGCRNNLTVA